MVTAVAESGIRSTRALGSWRKHRPGEAQHKTGSAIQGSKALTTIHQSALSMLDNYPKPPPAFLDMRQTGGPGTPSLHDSSRLTTDALSLPNCLVQLESFICLQNTSDIPEAFLRRDWLCRPQSKWRNAQTVLQSRRRYHFIICFENCISGRSRGLQWSRIVSHTG